MGGPGAFHIHRTCSMGRNVGRAGWLPWSQGAPQGLVFSARLVKSFPRHSSLEQDEVFQPLHFTEKRSEAQRGKASPRPQDRDMIRTSVWGPLARAPSPGGPGCIPHCLAPRAGACFHQHSLSLCRGGGSQTQMGPGQEGWWCRESFIRKLRPVPEAGGRTGRWATASLEPSKQVSKILR